MRRHDELFETGDLDPTSGGAPRGADESSGDGDPDTAEAQGTESSKTAPRGGESLDRYLREVSRWKLLSAEAERALGRRATRGDPAALEEMITRNLRLVVYWAKRYAAADVPIQDLIQEGNIGLMRAAERYDPGKGTRFSTYASWWIRQAISRAICDRQDLIRIPVHMHQKMRIIDRMLESTGAFCTPGADIEATVEDLGVIPFKDWERARRLQQSVSLDRRTAQDRDDPIEVEDQQAVNPMREVHLREIREQVSRLLKGVPVRHRTILRLRYGLDGEIEHTLESIAARLHISRERVRQIQTEAIERIAKSTGMPRPVPPVTWRRGEPVSFTEAGLRRLRGMKTGEGPVTRRRSSGIIRGGAATIVPERRRRVN